MQNKESIDMIEFKIHKQEYSLKNRIFRELKLLLIMVIIILFFTGINVIYLTSLLLIYILLLSMQRNRIITHILFDDKQQKLTICFFHMIFFKRVHSINYHHLGYKYRMKRFGLGTTTPTIEFFEKNKLQGEIHHSGNWKWQMETIENICKKLETIKTKK